MSGFLLGEGPFDRSQGLLFVCVCVYIWWVNDFIFLMKFLMTEHDQLYMLLFEIDAQSFDNDNVSFV